MNRLILSHALAAAFLFAQDAAPAEPKLLLQKPALGPTQIAFAYAGDLWLVSRQGGVAERLTTGAGVETRPYFSPDGTEIAFTGEYDGNVDIYLIPTSGGVPKRLTWHPSQDDAMGWTPNGKSILFASDRASYSRFTQLFTVPETGGLPDVLPLPIAGEGTFSPDGTRVAYTPLNRAFSMWKHYRGGRASTIWIARLSDSTIEKIPQENGSNDFNPVWVDERVFFLSDRRGRVTLFAYDTRKKTVMEMVRNTGLDFKSASAGPGAIVYEQFGSISLYDLKTGKTHPVEIRVTADLPGVRPHFEKVASRIHSASLSPTGVRAAFEARGEILTVPAENGDIRNLTNSPGVRELSPAWSPDGTRVAYFSDESGEYALHIAKQDGTGEVEKISLGAPGSFFYNPRWSPDSKKIAFVDKRLHLWYVDLANPKPVRVFQDTFTGPEQITEAVWSPDSKWLTYTRQSRSHMRSVYVYSIEKAESHAITDGMSDALSPVFDRGGKYLYLLASTDAGPLMDSSMTGFNRAFTNSVYVVVLRKDLPSPLAPESDEEKGAAEGEAAAADADSVKKAVKKEPVRVQIDFERINQRTLAMPLPPRNYRRLIAGQEGVLFLVEGAVSTGVGGPQSLTASKFDLKTRKTEKLIEGVTLFEVSDNGEKMLYRQSAPGANATAEGGEPPTPPQWTIAPTNPMPAGGAASAGGSSASSGNAGSRNNVHVLKLDGMEVRVDPIAEWKQMYHEAFRLERDFFYDPGFHGYDLEAAEKEYAPYLDGLGARVDLNYLFEEALGGLSVGHLRVNGGDFATVAHVPVGLLGADFKVENSRYRLTHVYDGENWNPQLRAPLTQPGVNAVAGEYILAVNGREVRGTEDVYSYFEAAAGKSVRLRLGPDPSGSGAREVTVVPVASERGLRNLAWVEDNRRKVDELSKGRLAYIYLPDTASGGYTFFNRYFFPQAGKEGAVVDERFNGGGLMTDYILDYLERRLLNYRTTRDGEDTTWPVSLIQGPKALIINEYAGSGGDAMPFHFRELKIGPLIGKRTWGGLVGFFGPQEDLMDGGVVSTPSRGFYTPGGDWVVENHGIPPDIDVDLDPAAVRQGHDPQLEKTVAVLLADLEKHPLPVAKKPAYPKYQVGQPPK